MDKQAKIDALRPKLTTEFLATLAEAAHVIGWDLDFMVVAGFVHTLHEVAGVPTPELRPDEDDPAAP